MIRDLSANSGLFACSRSCGLKENQEKKGVKSEYRRDASPALDSLDSFFVVSGYGCVVWHKI